MSQSFLETARITLEPITPIHIGSGESVDTFGFFLDEPRAARTDLKVAAAPGYLNGIDMEALFARAVDNPASKGLFTDILASSNRGDFSCRRILASQARYHKAIAFRIPISTQAFPKLKEAIEGRNQGEVHLLPRDAKGAYLPGSSLKGVIRTALIEEEAKNSENQNELLDICRTNSSRSDSSAKFESMVLGYGAMDRGRVRMNLNRDPFRQLSLSDLKPTATDATEIVRVQLIRISRESEDVQRIQMFREVTGSQITGRPVRFSGEVRVSKQFVGALRQRVDSSNRPSEKTRITDGVQVWLHTVHNHYLNRWQEELRRWERRLPKLIDIDDRIRCLEEHQALIRIGRHSHYECTTISEPFRQKPAKGYGKTRHVVDGQFPLGWAVLSLS